MKLGLIARADNSGLGIQTWEFYNAMHPEKTMVVDISKLNGNRNYPERYPDATFVRGIPTPNDIETFLQGLDVVFIAEAGYNWYLYERAHQLGVKTAVQYNYEFMDWLINDNVPKPDMLIAPSKWHYEDVENWCNENRVKHVYLHCPVNRDKLKFREIRAARTFLHTAGKSAAHDRNGTKTVIEAAKLLKTPAQIVIHFQGEQGLSHQLTTGIEEYQNMAQGIPNLTIVQDELADYQHVYAMGDVLLLPRRYGGNCLPLNEALSVGLPVIMTDISPNNQFLPQHWLVKTEKIGSFTPRTEVDIYEADPYRLARRIDKFYEMDETDMLLQNVKASNIAQSISWEYMRHKYTTVLEGLCTQ